MFTKLFTVARNQVPSRFLSKIELRSNASVYYSSLSLLKAIWERILSFESRNLSRVFDNCSLFLLRRIAEEHDDNYDALLDMRTAALN
jgi:hypothetical protein